MENKFKIDSFVSYVKYGEKKLCSIYSSKYMHIMNMLSIKYVILKKCNL